MTRRNHTILCWLLAVALAWLPIVSAMANTQAMWVSQTQEAAPCHEMNTVEQQDNTGLDGMDCCGVQYTADCTCSVSSSCNSLSGQNMASAILSDQTAIGVVASLQKMIPFTVSHHGTIVSPEIQPPII